MTGGARTWLAVSAFAAAATLMPAPREAKADPPVRPVGFVPVRATLPPREPLLERPSPSDLSAPDAASYSGWKGLSAGCSYMAPTETTRRAEEASAVDVVFHFHAGQMSERQMRESGTGAVFVSCGYGMGTGPYADAFANPSRFGFLVDRLRKNLESDMRTQVRFRHVALASWSAGFAAVGRILAVPRYYEMVDAVILLDSIHARYKGAGPHGASLGAEKVDVGSMSTWVRLATDATHGKKVLVMTHSSIVPPDYASSAEATSALLGAVGLSATRVEDGATADLGASTAAARGRPMSVALRADAGALHVRGYRGRGPKDHFDHLYLIGEALRSWVVPRWKREDRLVYTLASGQR